MANDVLVSVLDTINKPSWLNKIEKFVLNILDKLNYDNEVISIFFCDNQYISTLNKTYRNIDAPTDVLSFENGEIYADEKGIEKKCMGDIVISIEMIFKNANLFETDSDTELKRLLVHGLLHLNGYDHGDEHIENGKKLESDMLILQEKIISECCNDKIME